MNHSERMEKASDKAHELLVNEVMIKLGLNYDDAEETITEVVEDDEDMTKYTEEGQDRFNELYELEMDKIEGRLNINDIDISNLTVEIDFHCVVEREKYDLGTLRLKQGNKDLILDVTQSYSNDDNHHTTIQCKLEFDDTLDDSFENNMLLIDLYQKMDSATLFIGDEYEIEPESITLFIVNNGNTTAVDLTID